MVIKYIHNKSTYIWEKQGSTGKTKTKPGLTKVEIRTFPTRYNRYIFCFASNYANETTAALKGQNSNQQFPLDLGSGKGNV